MMKAFVKNMIHTIVNTPGLRCSHKDHSTDIVREENGKKTTITDAITYYLVDWKIPKERLTGKLRIGCNDEVHYRLEIFIDCIETGYSTIHINETYTDIKTEFDVIKSLCGG